MTNYPNYWLGHAVTYHGTHTEHHGIYTVLWWRDCFAVPCIQGCDGFEYVLKPLDPAAVNLKDGEGLVVHSIHITRTQPPATEDDSRQPRAPGDDPLEDT